MRARADGGVLQELGNWGGATHIAPGQLRVQSAQKRARLGGGACRAGTRRRRAPADVCA